MNHERQDSVPIKELEVTAWRDTFSIEVCTWKYPKHYDIYNLPDYEILCRKFIGFANEEKRRISEGFCIRESLLAFLT